MFDATNVAKDSDKSKCVYTDYGIAFDGAGSWIFRYGFARTVIILLLVFLDKVFKDKPDACNGCRDVSMMSTTLEILLF